MTPTLTTKRLVLRPLTKASQRQVDWLRDPKVVKYSEQRHQKHTLGSQLRYINALNGGGHYIWSLHLLASIDALHIGNLTATVDAPNKLADVGIMVGNTDCWNAGFGSEAWEAACAWLLNPDYAGLRKLEAGCASCNTSVINIMEKSGFVFEGERKNHFLIEGSPYGARYYGRFK